VPTCLSYGNIRVANRERKNKTDRIQVKKIIENLEKNISEDKNIKKEDGTYRLQKGIKIRPQTCLEW
jgi:hypothetical protein